MLFIENYLTKPQKKQTKFRYSEDTVKLLREKKEDLPL